MIQLVGKYNSNHLTGLLAMLGTTVAQHNTPDVLINHSVDSVNSSELPCIVINDDLEQLTADVRILCLHNIPTLPVLRTSCGGYIGPTYVDEGTACVGCARLRLLSNEEAAVVSDAKIENDSVRDVLWEVMLYRELNAFHGAVNGRGAPVVLTVNYLLDCDGILGTVERRRVLRVPSCDVCRVRKAPLFAAWQVGG